MSELPFLLEIGVEEIPDWMIVPALENMRELFSNVLTDNRLGGGVTSLDATPRRLVLRAEGLLRCTARPNHCCLGSSGIGQRGCGRGIRKEAGCHGRGPSKGADTER